MADVERETESREGELWARLVARDDAGEVVAATLWYPTFQKARERAEIALGIRRPTWPRVSKAELARDLLAALDRLPPEPRSPDEVRVAAGADATKGTT